MRNDQRFALSVGPRVKPEERAQTLRVFACFVSLSFAGLVVLARSMNPIPSRTRPLNSSAPMVLWLKPWESRSLPGLPKTKKFLFTCHDQTERRFLREAAFLRLEQASRKCRAPWHLPPAVLVEGVDLRDPIARDSITLLNGERMIRGLEFDVRANAVVAQMNPRLQILRARIERQLGREPTEEWADVRSP